MKVMNRIGAAVLAAVLASGTAVFADTGSATRYDSAIEQGVTQRLQKKSDFRNIQASVQDGIVTLRGTVPSFAQKLQAEKTARQPEHVAGVRDLLTVNTAEVGDEALQQQIAKKLRYIGYGRGTQVFDNFQVGVNSGVVTVKGETYDGFDKQEALADVASMKGVKDVIDEVKVAPVSNFDDEIRERLVREIYGGGTLAYGLDPQAPIRIIVDNGHVALYGFVNSQVDRALAGVRAAETFGVFGVQNHLQTPKATAD